MVCVTTITRDTGALFEKRLLQREESDAFTRFFGSDLLFYRTKYDATCASPNMTRCPCILHSPCFPGNTALVVSLDFTSPSS